MSRRRLLGAGLALGTTAVAAGCGVPGPADPSPTPAGPGSTSNPPSLAGSTPSPSATPGPSTAPEPVELPRGGRTVFPDYRLVGYCGYPGATALGRLGTGTLADRVDEIEERGREYAAGRQVLPVLELIATIVQGSPGADGKWRGRAPDTVVRQHLKAAREAKGLLLLNIQPGRSDFLTECRHFEDYLTEPDVGVALDPEWAMHAGQVPGRAYGWTTGGELDEVAAYLTELTADHGLPEKVMVFHQVAASVVRQESKLRAHDGVVIIKSVDGLGSGGAKINTYGRLTDDLADHVHAGFKLFFDEDTEGSSRLLTPKEVLALKPRPEYVMYE